MLLRPVQLLPCDTSLLTAYTQSIDLRSAVTEQSTALLCLSMQQEAKLDSSSEQDPSLLLRLLQHSLNELISLSGAFHRYSLGTALAACYCMASKAEHGILV